MTTPKETVPCRSCGVQVDDGVVCFVGLLPSPRERRMMQRWCQSSGTFPHGWKPWKRRIFESMVQLTGPWPSFICATCVDMAKEETEVGDMSSPIPVPEECLLDDDHRRMFIYWSDPQTFCNAERWIFQTRQSAHAMGVDLPGKPVIEGGGEK